MTEKLLTGTLSLNTTNQNPFITCFTKYSNSMLSYTVRYCSRFPTHNGLLVHRYWTARAPISARSRSSIKMAERPIEPQALNTLTSSFTKIKPKKPLKTVFVSRNSDYITVRLSPAGTQCTLCFLIGPVCKWLPVYEMSNLAHVTIKIKIQKLLAVYS